MAYGGAGRMWSRAHTTERTSGVGGDTQSDSGDQGAEHAALQWGKNHTTLRGDRSGVPGRSPMPQAGAVALGSPKAIYDENSATLCYRPVHALRGHKQANVELSSPCRAN